MKQATVKHVSATASLMGMNLTEPMLAMLCTDLARFADDDICRACDRVRLEGGRFDISRVIGEMPGGHPTPEEAWSAIPQSEVESGCVTQEIMSAWGDVQHLDKVAGRMAFKEIYLRLVKDKKMAGEMPKWFITTGSDPELREQAVIAATQRNRISPTYANTMLPHIPVDEFVAIANQTKTASQVLEHHSKKLEHLVDEPIENMPTSKRWALEEIKKLRQMLNDDNETENAA